MHVVDMFILMAIGQVMGWTATIYLETDHRRLPGNLIVTTAGAFIGGYLSISLISEFSKFSMIFSAFFVAGLLLYAARYRGGLFEKYSDAVPDSRDVITRGEISVAKQIKSIIVTLAIVIVIFLLLGWGKSLEIQS
jgi:hypothetical protein